MLLLQDGPRPHARGDRVAPVDAHPAALELLRLEAGRARCRDDGGVVEPAHQEHGQRGEWLAEGLRAQVRGQGHLGDVEVKGTHHPAEGPDQDRYLFELQRVPLRPHRAVLDRFSAALRSRHGREGDVCHNRLLLGAPTLVIPNPALVN